MQLWGQDVNLCQRNSNMLGAGQWLSQDLSSDGS